MLYDLLTRVIVNIKTNIKNINLGQDIFINHIKIIINDINRHSGMNIDAIVDLPALDL